MSAWKTLMPWKRALPVGRVLLPCLLVLASLAACGPGEEETELVELEEGVAPPATDIEGAELEPQPIDPGAGAAPEETPPERAPLGPELEAPPPPSEGAGTVDEEMPVDPDELEEELDAAEPVPPAPAPLAAAENAAAGREVFLAQGCTTCHGVSSAGLEGKTASGGDLAGLGDRLDRATLAALLRGEEEMANGKRHPKRFSGTQDELDALIDWLLAQE